MKLSELQALFQAGVLSGEGAKMLKIINGSTRGAEKETLFGIYQNAYRIRLAEFIAEDYPGLHGYLGDEGFEALTEEFIAATPPRHRNARYYTTALPDFMQASESWSDEARAISLALFERAIVDAFDAADAETLAIQALAAYSPNEWPKLSFAFHASLQMLELAAGTLETFAASSDDECEEIPEEQEGIERIAVWRAGHEPAYRELDADEYLALNEALAGRVFGDICQMAAFQRGEDMTAERLAQFLASWFEEGMIIGVQMDAER